MPTVRMLAYGAPVPERPSETTRVGLAGGGTVVVHGDPDDIRARMHAAQPMAVHLEPVWFDDDPEPPAAVALRMRDVRSMARADDP